MQSLNRRQGIPETGTKRRHQSTSSASSPAPAPSALLSRAARDDIPVDDGVDDGGDAQGADFGGNTSDHTDDVGLDDLTRKELAALACECYLVAWA